jgi:tRNA A-37 threonylcarbamoyl transferase component Bud32
VTPEGRAESLWRDPAEQTGTTRAMVPKAACPGPLAEPPSTSTATSGGVVAAAIVDGSDGITVGERPSAGRARRVLGADVETPDDAMRYEEIQTTKGFLLAGVSLSVVVIVALPFLGGDAMAAVLLLGGIAISLATMLWAYWALRVPNGYQLRHGMTLAIVGALGGYCAIYYFGLLSAANLATLMGIFFFAMTHRLAVAAVTFVAACIGPIALWVLVTSGALADRGIIALGDKSTVHQLILLTLIQFIFFITYLIARSSRRWRVNATVELGAAIRQIAHREALLHEAKRELDRALRVGGPGRFTDQIMGSYRLGLLAGRGAMGEVYAAQHVATRAPAAVKLLHRSVLGDSAQVRRFIREANIARSLCTHHVVRVLEVGDDKAPLPYLAMELLRGEDLAQQLRRYRRLTLAQAARLVDEVARGLAVAHAAGVVHRDLKPRNLFFHQVDPSQPGVWKVLDFGVSCLASNDGTITQGHAVGTPSYMAPEQARGRSVDHRADIFALAAVAYRCIVGRPAFSGRDVPETLHRVVYHVPPRPSEIAEVPEDLDRVFAIALAKRPRDRFDSATEFAAHMKDAIRSSLSAAARSRGRALIEQFPWGSQLK